METETHTPNGNGKQRDYSSSPPAHTGCQAIRRLPGDSALPRSNRGFSRKLQDMIKHQTKTAVCDDKPSVSEPKVKFEPKNWKQLSDKELSKMSLIERSRYLAYEPKPKETVERQQESIKRLRTIREKAREYNQRPSIEEVIEYERNSELVGQLKSAEARQRIKLMRLDYQHYREEGLAHLISSQPSSIEAVRLQSFIPPTTTHRNQTADKLTKHERVRCEALLEDEEGLTTNRKQ